MAARDVRASVLGVNSSAPRLEQNPTGTIAQLGRQMAGLIYVGILAAGPVVVKGDAVLAVSTDLPELGALPGSSGMGGCGGLT